MVPKSAYRTAVPLALAVVVGLFTVASAQQGTKEQTPAKQAKPSKSAPKSEAATPKSESKAAPAKKGTAAPAPTPTAGGGSPTLLAQYGEWGAYTANGGGRTICYALAKPSSQATVPAGRPRDPAYVFVSTRPAENVRNEVSIVIGYPFKPGYEASADIGSAKYAMYTQVDGAWVKNAAEEARMVETMRKGSEMVVAGESGKGTKSTDRYNLKGLGQALDRIAQECK